MPFMYPEQLRELRSQYPNTQFDGHGRVIGGMPLDQYNAQPANPAAIPASVRTYSQFDPATGTWVRHTNGAASPVQGMTPTSTPGIYLRPRQQAQPQPQPARQVRRPLARGNTVDISAAIASQPIVVNGETSLGVDGRGITPSGVEFVGGQPVSLDRTQNIPTEYDGEIRSANGIPASSGVVGQPVVNVDSAEIGQAVPIREATPRLDLNGYTPPTQGEVNLGRALGGAATATLIPAIIGGSLMYGPTVAGAALGLGRTALAGGLGAAAKVLPKNMTSRVSSWANSALDAGKSLLNRAGGFLQRPTPTAQTYTKVRPTHNMVNPNARRSANYYGH